MTSDFSGKQVMITGGLGFIGSNLAIKLIELNANVIIIDSLFPEGGANYYNIESIKKKVKIIKDDIRNDSINNYVKNVDYIFNLAAQTSHTRSMEDPLTDTKINCLGHLNLLEACRKNNPDVKIIFTGTRNQYGRAEYLPVDEKHPLNPTDVNGINKNAAEIYHLMYNKTYGTKTLSLRITNTYGPRHQMQNSEQGFLHWFIRLAMDNEIIKIFGDGKQLRDFIYVDDVVDAIILTAVKEQFGKAFNVASGKPISIADAAKMIINNAGGSIENAPFPEHRKKIEIGDFYADISKIKKLGWQPKTSFEQGLKRTIDYYKKNKQKYW